MGEGVSVILFIFHVHVAGLSREVMANQRNVACPRRIEDIGFAGDESSGGGLSSLGNVSWEIGAKTLLLFLLLFLFLIIKLNIIIFKKIIINVFIMMTILIIIHVDWLMI